MIVTKMFGRTWLFTTLVVLAGTAVCIRLGKWQLDRLDQRLAFNAQVEAMQAAPALDFNKEIPADLDSMEWRVVSVAGKYDFENQVLLRNQYHGDQYGYHVITPLLFSGGAVLVDRGWIPADADPRAFDEAGEVNVKGQIRLGQGKPGFGGVADALPLTGGKLFVWNNLDSVNISAQLGYPALIIYIQPDTVPGDEEPPIPFQPEIELTEGPHFGYALQWFAFAAILFIGYPFYLRRQV